MPLLAKIERVSSLAGADGRQRSFRDKITPQVRDDSEIARVLAAPQRPVPSQEEMRAFAAKWTAALMLPGHDPAGKCGCPIYHLNGPQGWALEEAAQAGEAEGILGSLKVGAGKTGLDVLLAMVVPGVKIAVLLIPPALRAQFAADFKRWSLHFRVPNLSGSAGPWYPQRPVLRVLAYSELSHAAATTWFQAHRPDLVILDECQSLQDRKSVRTHRFLSYIGEAPGTRVCAYSGSLTSRSIEQYAHTAAVALRAKSPLPIDPVVTYVWAGTLDPIPPGGMTPPPGALTKLCLAGESPRAGYLRRLRETPGVVTTEDSRLDVKLFTGARDIKSIPPAVREALAFVRTRQARPDGEEFAEAAEVAACAKQVATGMYLRWKFPRGEPEALIEEWRQARKGFARELREKLMHRRPHLDSPALCVAAAQRHFAGYTGEKPTWASSTWERWAGVCDKVQPISEAVWIDDFLVRDALAWALERPGIVWVGHPAFGHLLAKVSQGRVPYLGGGDVNSELIARETGTRSIAASIASHGTGKNLQAFHRNLIVDVPSDAGIVEQLVGRTYRYGQRRDVTAERYAHTQELTGAWDSVLRGAQYVRETTGSLHGVLFAEELTRRPAPVK